MIAQFQVSVCGDMDVIFRVSVCGNARLAMHEIRGFMAKIASILYHEAMTDSQRPVLEAENLVKRYGELLAVDDVSFSVAAGSVTTLLGPNGSGKTTILRAVGATARLNSGRILIDGLDVAERPRDAKYRLGVVHQEDTLDPDLTVRENLLVHARYFAVPANEAAVRTTELLARFGLSDRGSNSLSQLSGGMRRRLMLARAFFRARLLILDEPTTGLDPEARLELWGDLRSLLGDGAAILLTTHDMEEAERLSDRVVLLDRGRKRSEGTPAELIEEFTSGRVFEIRVPVPRLHEAAEFEREVRGLLKERNRVRRHGGFLFCETPDETALRQWALEKSLPLTVRPATLGDVYLAVTGHGLDE
jgi:lipooligosaccharide transport system ATP-binding protein